MGGPVLVGGSSAIATPLAPLPNAALATRDRVRDLTALALLAASAFVIAALATFDPADPPLARMFPPHAWATNACGFFGSAVASSLYEIFGLGAWFVVVLIAGLDLLLLNRRVMSDLPLRTSGAVVATVGICTLLAMFLPDWVGRPIWGPGGYTGATGRLFAEAYLRCDYGRTLSGLRHSLYSNDDGLVCRSGNDGALPDGMWLCRCSHCRLSLPAGPQEQRSICRHTRRLSRPQE